MNFSWMMGDCKECAYPVVVTQGLTDLDDYCWYCSNPVCSKHNAKEGTGDTENPEWVDMRRNNKVPLRYWK